MMISMHAEKTFDKIQEKLKNPRGELAQPD